MTSITDLKRELKEVSEKLEIIEDALKNIMNGISDEEIGVGSRVLITHLSKPIEGRVWRVKNKNVFAVNRDGYAHELLVAGENLKHLSIGTFGKLERQQWVLKNRIKNLQWNIDEQLKKEIYGIRELLSKGITLDVAKSIINRKDFQVWYITNHCEKSISLAELKNASPIFICGIAREFIIISPNEIVWQAIIYNQIT